MSMCVFLDLHIIAASAKHIKIHAGGKHDTDDVNKNTNQPLFLHETKCQTHHGTRGKK